MVLLLLYAIGIFYGLFIVILFFNTTIVINSAILSAFGIMISAFIASFSLRESIANTNRLENEKVKRELFDRRKKIIFLLGEFYNILFKSYHKSDFILDKDFMKESIKTLADAQYIFDKKDYKIIKLFSSDIYNLIKKISQMNLEEDENEKNKWLRKIEQSQNELLESLNENLKHIEESIQLTK